MAGAKFDDIFNQDGRLRQECFTAAGIRALRAAVDVAMRTGWPSVRSPHLFIALLEEADEPVVKWLEQNGLSGSRLRKSFLELFEMSDQLQSPQLSLQRSQFSEHLQEILQQARQRALQRGGLPVTTADLLAAVLTCEPSVVVECLRREGFETGKLVRSALDL